jgi:hypothetical protein
MANPTLYKKKPIQDIKNKVREQLTFEEKSRVDLIINKFFELFKLQHLG